MASQLLAGLAGLGHRIEAIAPITPAALRSGDRFATGDHGLRVTRFLMPYLDTSPDTPPATEYREQERRQITQLVTSSLAHRPPDVLLVGRESFAAHLAGVVDAPRVLLVQGSTTNGIVNGSYPADLGKSLLRNFREFDAVVTPALHMQRTLAELGVPGVEMIPNPVDLDRFRPGPASAAVRRALAVGDTQVLIAHLSNLKALKRPLDIVDAADAALREDDRLVFVIVGDGPCRAALVDAAAAHGLASRFRFPGWLDHDRIPEVVRSSDIVVMPSEAEAQALVYLETQASGRPLIASDIPAAREVIEDGVTGLLFGRGDPGELAARILLCASDPELRAELGRRARRDVARHSLRRVVAAYSQLLESVVASSGSRREGAL